MHEYLLMLTQGRARYASLNTSSIYSCQALILKSNANGSPWRPLELITPSCLPSAASPAARQQSRCFRFGSVGCAGAAVQAARPVQPAAGGSRRVGPVSLLRRPGRLHKAFCARGSRGGLREERFFSWAGGAEGGASQVVGCLGEAARYHVR